MKNSEINKIVKKLIQYKKDYYEGEPVIGDKEFDTLEDFLRKTDPNNPYFGSVGHDTPSLLWKKATHSIPMCSLDKVDNKSDMAKWVSKLPKSEFVLQPKLDGLSVSLTYSEGVFEKGIVRGDGFEGEDISRNIKIMGNFSTSFKSKFTGSLRAEIVLPKDIFKSINLILPEDKKYSNPRNAAAGIARRLDGNFCKHLYLIYFDVSLQLDETDKVMALKSQGLDVVSTIVCKNFKEIDIAFEALKQTRENLPYLIDGAVVKIISNDTQKSLGLSQNRPKGQKAWKFSATGLATIFIREEWGVGRTGVITPVAILEPVNIDGVMVRRATFHNIAEIRRLGVGRGDVVMLERRGDVIPKVTSVLRHKGNPIVIPKICPSCSGAVSNDGITLTCGNALCPGKKFFRILNWIKVVKIDSFGESLAGELFSQEKLTCIADIYKLEKSDIKHIERWGDISANKIIANIKKAQTITPEIFLTALGVPGISYATSKELFVSFKDIESILNASVSDIEGLKGFAETSAENVVKGLSFWDKEIRHLLTILTLSSKTQNGVLNNLSFCFTGAMKKPRPVYMGMVEKNGGMNKSSVTKDLSYLICNEDKGLSKITKAKKYGVKVINEKQFLEMVPKEEEIEKIKVKSYTLFEPEQ